MCKKDITASLLVFSRQFWNAVPQAYPVHMCYFTFTVSTCTLYLDDGLDVLDSYTYMGVQYVNSMYELAPIFTVLPCTCCVMLCNKVELFCFVVVLYLGYT